MDFLRSRQSLVLAYVLTDGNQAVQMNTPSSVSSVIERLKGVFAADRRLRQNAESLIRIIAKSQEQT